MTGRISRAVAFIDGANFYHSVKAIGLRAGDIDPRKVAGKLAESRRLTEVRYYIAAIDRSAPDAVYRAYVRTRERLAKYGDVRICTGHIQRIRETNPCARELGAYLARLPTRLPPHVFQAPIGIASRHRSVVIYREKGVDVALACDLVDLARRDAFDVAYLVSGDADFCPAVAIAQSTGKRVFAASPDIAARLVRASDAAIKLTAPWLADCRD